MSDPRLALQLLLKRLTYVLHALFLFGTRCMRSRDAFNLAESGHTVCPSMEAQSYSMVMYGMARCYGCVCIPCTLLGMRLRDVSYFSKSALLWSHRSFYGHTGLTTVWVCMAKPAVAMRISCILLLISECG